MLRFCSSFILHRSSFLRTHRIELRKLEDIDDEVRGWLERAWERDG
ncbi:MAG TPA: hypothetical protein VJ276_20030 [Thermoanaerobaculia bacterium]|nr:hypothetical protein [Thermoanaerobaculia bacterium]